MPATDNFQKVRDEIDQAAVAAGRAKGSVRLIAVSKTRSADEIRPLLAAGHRLFGENRVQEAQGKWPDLKRETDGIELHLIGPLQSNKAAAAVELFDAIETIDREKIAREVAREITRQGRQPIIYVQVNTGSEPQKAGVTPQDTVAFVEKCRTEFGLDVTGLMCIPPVDENPAPHFALLAKLAGRCGVSRLSMGMSGDFETAIAFGATEVRVGTAIFGARN